jgi:hypothetical protein
MTEEKLGIVVSDLGESLIMPSRSQCLQVLVLRRFLPRLTPRRAPSCRQ